MSAPAIATPQAATRFALTYGSSLAAGEDPKAYERHVKDQYRQYKPLAEHELFLTQELADAMWRLNRARRMESQATTIDQLAKVGKYIASIERSYHRAYTELKKIAAEREKSSGIPYSFHSCVQNEPDWTAVMPPPNPKIQNEPSLKFMLNDFRKSNR